MEGKPYTEFPSKSVRRDWFPGPGGYGRPKRRPNGDVILIIALILVSEGEAQSSHQPKPAQVYFVVN
ncbi:MAG: hypothetical protein NTV82_12485, partial [Candidatus Aminicenantes bacterium]|nr:hypothetical protein [Candidatus Aminicenantes bacterium]